MLECRGKVAFAHAAPLGSPAVRTTGKRLCPRRPVALSSSGAAGGSGTLPGGYSYADYSANRIRWKDRVALQSQVGSAVDTLEVLLAALRNNKAWSDVGLPGDTRFKDEGLEALYEFANFDVWSLRTTFFGRRLDLGQFERFKTVMVSDPFAITLIGEYAILSHFTPSPERAHIRVLFRAPRRDHAIFDIAMSRVMLGESSSWMLDSFIHDAEASVTPDRTDLDSVSLPSSNTEDDR